MKIGTILTATNNNIRYYNCVPLFVKAWQLILPEADIKIIYIGNELPSVLEPYMDYIIMFEPIDGMYTAFQAQCIRLLYPRLISRQEGVLITDMDMIPLNKSYYVDSISDIDDTYFVAYRDKLYPSEIFICYNVALPSVWAALFGGTHNIRDILKSWYKTIIYEDGHNKSGWSTDQAMLVKYYDEYNGPKKMLTDTYTKYMRLDRALIIDLLDKYDSTIIEIISKKIFSDYHLMLPYNCGSHLADHINNSVLEWLEMTL